MSEASSKSKQLAKNTVVLYCRMIVMTLISLYTSRVVLAVLGVEDFGIYNVVGGFVSMFSLVSASMATTISRFLTFELGKNDYSRLRVVFSTSVNIQIALCVIVFVLAETIGLWFLNYKLNIPEGRMVAANWVYQLSLLSFFINLINVPYYSIIVAHEKMTVFAYFSIFEAILKLAVVFLLGLFANDRLILYSIFLFISLIIIRLGYGIYCNRNFEESKYLFVLDRGLLKEMGSFAGWNYLGAGAYIMRTQGLNMLLNMFFGVVVNAARGIATQIENTVVSFVSNFTMALTPQITKSYAQDDKDYMNQLVCLGAKYSYFMMMIVVIPLLYEAPIVLKLWLGIVPDYTSLFLRLTLIAVLFDTLSDSIGKAILASGEIKIFQIYVSGLVLMIFPVSYFLYALGFPVYSCYVVCIIAMLLKLFIELPLLQKYTGLPIKLYVSTVVYRVIPVSIISVCAPFVFYHFFEESIIRLIILSVFSIITTLITVFLFGLTKKERSYVITRFFKKNDCI